MFAWLISGKFLIETFKNMSSFGGKADSLQFQPYLGDFAGYEQPQEHPLVEFREIQQFQNSFQVMVVSKILGKHLSNLRDKKNSI